MIYKFYFNKHIFWNTKIILYHMFKTYYISVMSLLINEYNFDLHVKYPFPYIYILLSLDKSSIFPSLIGLLTNLMNILTGFYWTNLHLFIEYPLKFNTVRWNVTRCALIIYAFLTLQISVCRWNLHFKLIEVWKEYRYERCIIKWKC